MFSCRGHGPLCPAYSHNNKQIKNLNTEKIVFSEKEKGSWFEKSPKSDLYLIYT